MKFRYVIFSLLLVFGLGIAANAAETADATTKRVSTLELKLFSLSAGLGDTNLNLESLQNSVRKTLRDLDDERKARLDIAGQLATEINERILLSSKLNDEQMKRAALAASLDDLNDEIKNNQAKTAAELGVQQKKLADDLVAQQKRIDGLQVALAALDKKNATDLQEIRTTMDARSLAAMTAMTNQLAITKDDYNKQITDLTAKHKTDLEKMAVENDAKLAAMRTASNEAITAMQASLKASDDARTKAEISMKKQQKRDRTLAFIGLLVGAIGIAR